MKTLDHIEEQNCDSGHYLVRVKMKQKIALVDKVKTMNDGIQRD